MYEIRPESLSTFIESKIKLPRFQRKQAWNEKKNFELCLSIVKGFPIGVCIIQEEIEKGSPSYWLLDGRQRREALKRMNENPENIYEWARKWIGFKSNESIDVIEAKMRDKVNEYLEHEDSEEEDNASNEIAEDDFDVDGEDIGDDGDAENSELGHTSDEDDGEDLGQDVEAGDAGTIPRSPQLDGLEFLVELLRTVHPKQGKKGSFASGFTKPFDFGDLLPRVPYIKIVGKARVPDSSKLRKVIGQYLQEIGNDDATPTSFVEFWSAEGDCPEDKKQQFQNKVEETWNRILPRIELVQRLKDLFQHSKIGYIEVKDVRSADAQKIFNIINSKGTKLTAAEVLSAKPSWNVEVPNPSEEQEAAAKALYEQIGTSYDYVAKWDLAASIMSRVSGIEFFLNYLDKGAKKNQKNLDKRTTLGFKLLSGLFQGGIKKEDIENLSKTTGFDWSSDYEPLVEDLEALFRLIRDHEYFKYLSSWRIGITDLTSDAVALNFLLLIYRDWERKGKPTGRNTKAQQVQKNAFMLIDRLFYEYVTREWRGSSDSRIAANIKSFSAEKDLFIAIEEKQWLSVLNDIFDNHSVQGVKIKQKDMKPLLYHFYALKKMMGPESDQKIEIDHIFPQKLFKVAKFQGKEVAVHNLLNLALLPKKENISKGDKALKELTGDWLPDVVERYSMIPRKDFVKYSDLSNWDQFKKTRVALITNAFKNDRQSVLKK